MTRLNTSDVSIFNQVAKSLSFSSAARETGSSRSAISKSISRLEKNLGVILFNRSTRSVSLTEAGRTLLLHTSEVDAIIKRAVEDIRAADLEPTGTVRLCIPSSLSTMLLLSLLPKFQTLWPKVSFDIHIEDHVVDMIAGGYDLAIAVSPKLRDSSLVSRRLGTTSKILAASPAYLGQFGMPESLQELEEHRCLGFAEGSSRVTTWTFNNDDRFIEIPCTFSVQANNVQALVDAACCDNGIVYMPQAYIDRELSQRRLERILADAYVPMTYGIFAVYPHRNAAAKVKVLVEFIEQELKEMDVLG